MIFVKTHRRPRRPTQHLPGDKTVQIWNAEVTDAMIEQTVPGRLRRESSQNCSEFRVFSHAFPETGINKVPHKLKK